MEYLIRFAQTHETFRQPELQALANLHNTDLEILHYDQIVSVISSQFLLCHKSVFLSGVRGYTEMPLSQHCEGLKT
jgi:tRNA G10  N-methylase Trm11